MVGMKPTIKIKWPAWKAWHKVISAVDASRGYHKEVVNCRPTHGYPGSAMPRAEGVDMIATKTP